MVRVGWRRLKRWRERKVFVSLTQIKSGVTPASRASTVCWSSCASICPKLVWWRASARAWPYETSWWPWDGKTSSESSFWSAGQWRSEWWTTWFYLEDFIHKTTPFTCKPTKTTTIKTRLLLEIKQTLTNTT